MSKMVAVSLSIGVLLLPTLAAQPGQPATTGEVLRPSAEEWCPEGAEPSPDNDCITPPVLLHAVSPEYPDLARKARVTGVVAVEAVVDERGEVVDVRVLTPNRLFTDAAVAALRQRIYRPAIRRGEPVATYFSVVVRFDLVVPDGRPKMGRVTGESEVVTVFPYDPKTGIEGTQEQQPVHRDATGTKK